MSRPNNTAPNHPSPSARVSRILAAEPPPPSLDDLCDLAVARGRQSLRPTVHRAPQHATPIVDRVASEQPVALVLIINVLRCACGREHRAPNETCLVRYGNPVLMQNSVHYRREDAERFAHLPRETKERYASIPFCEGCF